MKGINPRPRELGETACKGRRIFLDTPLTGGGPMTVPPPIASRKGRPLFDSLNCEKGYAGGWFVWRRTDLSISDAGGARAPMKACQLHRLVGSVSFRRCRSGFGMRGFCLAARGWPGARKIRSHRVNDEMCDGSNVKERRGARFGLWVLVRERSRVEPGIESALALST